MGYSIVFLACHYFFKEKLNKLVINQGAVVDSLLEDVRAHSLKIGFLIRFTPLPLGLQNTVMAVCLPPSHRLLSFFLSVSFVA